MDCPYDALLLVLCIAIGACFGYFVTWGWSLWRTRGVKHVIKRNGEALRSFARLMHDSPDDSGVFKAVDEGL